MSATAENSPMRTRAGSSMSTATNADDRHQSDNKWDIVKQMVFKKQRTLSAFGTIDVEALKQQAQLPYNISIRHGFLPKQSFSHRQPILYTVPHPKIPAHFEHRVARALQELEQQIMAGEKLDASSEVNELKQMLGLKYTPATSFRGPLDLDLWKDLDAKDIIEQKDSLDTVQIVEQTRKFPRSKKSFQYSIAFVDKMRCAHVIDTSANATDSEIIFAPSTSQPLNAYISQFVLLSQFGIYATCSNDQVIRFFGSEWQFMDTAVCSHQVLFLRYHSITNQLIAVGPSELSVWNLRMYLNKREARIEANLSSVIELEGVSKDNWVTAAYLQEGSNKIAVVVKSKVLVYDIVTGKRLLSFFNSRSNRQITCITVLDFVGYILLGMANGQVLVYSQEGEFLHEFHGHTKAVTSLSVYPFGPLVVSGSLDATIRVTNVKLFKEVYSTMAKGPVLSLQVLDEATLCVQTANEILMYNINHMNVQYCDTNAKIKNTELVQEQGFPPRLVIQSEDGTIRIASGSTGETLTTHLPLIESEKIKNVAYSRSIDRLFVLTHHQEIYVVDTTINPCIIVDIWKAGERREESCNFIAVYTHPHQSATSRQSRVDKDHVFLLGASSDGQIYIFNRFGSIAERYQIHSGSITALAVNANQQCICTAASDNTIKIMSVNPYAKKRLAIAMTIPITFVPRHIRLSESAILAATEDGVVSMYSFNLVKSEFKFMNSHNRADDHTEPIRDASSFQELDLFYTVSSDKTLKVWDIWNTLIREIQFDDPVPSVCCLNNKGDILVALKNRLDIIPGQLYLPPGLLNVIDSATVTSALEFEKPLPFHPEIEEFWRQVKNQVRKRRIMAVNMKEPTIEEALYELDLNNIDGLDEVTQEKTLTIPNDAEVLLENLLDRLEKMKNKLLATIREEYFSLQGYHGPPLGSDILKEIGADTRNSTMSMASVHDLDDSRMSYQAEPSSPILKMKTKPAAVVDSIFLGPPIKNAEQSEDEDSANGDVSDDSSEDSFDMKMSRGHKKGGARVFIAPDGAIPNTITGAEVDDWLKKHGKATAWFNNTAPRFTQRKSKSQDTEAGKKSVKSKSQGNKKISKFKQKLLQAVTEGEQLLLVQQAEEEKEQSGNDSQENPNATVGNDVNSRVTSAESANGYEPMSFSGDQEQFERLKSETNEGSSVMAIIQQDTGHVNEGAPVTDHQTPNLDENKQLTMSTTTAAITTTDGALVTSNTDAVTVNAAPVTVADKNDEAIRIDNASSSIASQVSHPQLQTTASSQSPTDTQSPSNAPALTPISAQISGAEHPPAVAQQATSSMLGFVGELVPVPRIIVTIVEADWFPHSEVFAPVSITSDEPRTKYGKLLIDPTPITVQSVILNAFKNPKYSANDRLDMLTYLEWVGSEFKFASTSSLFKAFSAYLLSNWSDYWDEDELGLRLELIDRLPKYAMSSGDIAPVLLPFIMCKVDILREKAIEIFQVLGVRRLECDVLYQQLNWLSGDMVDNPDAKKAAFFDGISISFDCLKVLLSKYEPKALTTLAVTKHPALEIPGSTPRVVDYEPLFTPMVVPPRTPGINVKQATEIFLRQALKQMLVETSDVEAAAKLATLDIFGFANKEKKPPATTKKALKATKPEVATTSSPKTKSGQTPSINSSVKKGAIGKETDKKESPTSASSKQKLPVSTNATKKSVSFAKNTAKPAEKVNNLDSLNEEEEEDDEEDEDVEEVKAEVTKAAGKVSSGVDPEIVHRQKEAKLKERELYYPSGWQSDNSRKMSILRQNEDEKTYDSLRKERPEISRSATLILQVPTLFDFLSALNYFIISREKVIVFKELSRQEAIFKAMAEEEERLRREEENRIRAEEEARIQEEQARLRAEQEVLEAEKRKEEEAARELEKQLKEEQRKVEVAARDAERKQKEEEKRIQREKEEKRRQEAQEAVRLARLERERVAEEANKKLILPAIKHNPIKNFDHIKSRAKEGIIHESACHGSREHLEYRLFKSISSIALEDGTRIHVPGTYYTNHIRNLARTIPMEHVTLDPFIGASNSSVNLSDASFEERKNNSLPLLPQAAKLPSTMFSNSTTEDLMYITGSLSMASQPLAPTNVASTIPRFATRRPKRSARPQRRARHDRHNHKTVGLHEGEREGDQFEQDGDILLSSSNAGSFDPSKFMRKYFVPSLSVSKDGGNYGGNDDDILTGTGNTVHVVEGVTRTNIRGGR